MDPMIENEIERGLIEKAKRVLPGGTFGNVSSVRRQVKAIGSLQDSPRARRQS